MQMIAEDFKIVPVLSDLDLSGTDASMPADSINMKNAHRATFLINLQTLAGASATCKVYSGATDGALTSALTFRYAFMTAAKGGTDADVLLAWTSASSVTLTHGTYDNFMLVIDILASEMDTANNEEWLTLDFQDPDTGATGNLSAVAILTPRYPGNCSASVLV